MIVKLKCFVATSVFMLLGCSSTEISPMDAAEASPLEGRWVLISYSSDAVDLTPAVDAIPFNFAFNISEQGQPVGFFGFDGCNVFTTAEALEEGNVIMPVNGVNVDGRFCGSLEFAEYLMQFDFFYSVISDTFSYHRANTQLILKSLTGSTLTFDPCVAVDPDSLDSICEPL